MKNTAVATAEDGRTTLSSDTFELPEVTALVPDCLYDISKAGIIDQGQIDAANLAANARILTEDNWEDELQPSVSALVFAVADIFPQASVSLSRAEWRNTTPWILEVNYNLEDADIDTEATYGKHRLVLDAFLEHLGHVDPELLSLRREFSSN